MLFSWFKKYETARYQECPWYVRVWRLRWYLYRPILALRLYYGTGADPDIKLKWDFCWSLSKGLVQEQMRWWYTSEEVFARLEVYRQERDAAKKEKQDVSE